MNKSPSLPFCCPFSSVGLFIQRPEAKFSPSPSGDPGEQKSDLITRMKMYVNCGHSRGLPPHSSRPVWGQAPVSSWCRGDIYNLVSLICARCHSLPHTLCPSPIPAKQEQVFGVTSQRLPSSGEVRAGASAKQLVWTFCKVFCSLENRSGEEEKAFRVQKMLSLQIFAGPLCTDWIKVEVLGLWQSP